MQSIDHARLRAPKLAEDRTAVVRLLELLLGAGVLAAAGGAPAAAGSPAKHLV